MAAQTDPSFPSRSFEKKFRNPILPVLLGVAVFLGACGYIAYQRAIVAPNRQATRNAQTVKAQHLTLPITVSANGTVQAERAINVSPKTAGVLKSLRVKEGDSVMQGQILAEMDASNLQGQLTQAKGQLASAQATLQKLLVGNRPEEIVQAQARLDNTLALLHLAEDDLNRQQALAEAGAISRQALVKALTNRETANAQATEAQQALVLQQAGSRSEDIQQARAQVLQAQGAIQTIQAQIEDTVIRAPFTGVVSRKFADPGAFVTPTTAGSSVLSATSSSVLSLASKNQVVAYVAESNIAQIHPGQAVTLIADAYTHQTFTGEVTQVAAQSVVQQNVTSFEVKIAIRSDLQQLLRTGMNVQVTFSVGQLKQALVVPTVAIVRQQNQTGVFVLGDDQTAAFMPIETGVTVEDKTEVRSGLQGSERILMSSPSPQEKRSPSSLLGSEPQAQYHNLNVRGHDGTKII